MVTPRAVDSFRDVLKLTMVENFLTTLMGAHTFRTHNERLRLAVVLSRSGI